MGDDERQFTEREVREILKRATEGAPSRDIAPRKGHSLAELKAIAGEVGINPHRLEEAARSVAAQGRNRPVLLTGAPRVMSFERTVEGTLDPEDTPRVLAVIRRSMGHKGVVEEIHGSLEWSESNEFMDHHVALTSRGGRTTIATSANLTNAAIMTYLPAGMLAAVISFMSLTEFVKDGGAGALVLGLAIIPVVLTVLRLVMKNIASGEAQKLEGVIDDLTCFVTTDEDEPA